MSTKNKNARRSANVNSPVSTVSSASDAPVVTSAISSENTASAVATANVLAKLARLEDKQKNAAERAAAAAKLLVKRNVLNVMRTQRKAAEAKKAASVPAHKTPRYNSIYAGVTNMHVLGAMLLFNKASEEVIADAFIAAYALKNVTDAAFIVARSHVYLTHAKTLDELKKLNAAAAAKAAAAAN